MFSFLTADKLLTIGSRVNESPSSDLEKELGFLMCGLGNSGLETSALIYYALHLALNCVQMMFSRTP